MPTGISSFGPVGRCCEGGREIKAANRKWAGREMEVNGSSASKLRAGINGEWEGMGLLRDGIADSQQVWGILELELIYAEMALHIYAFWSEWVEARRDKRERSQFSVRYFSCFPFCFC